MRAHFVGDTRDVVIPPPSTSAPVSSQHHHTEPQSLSAAPVYQPHKLHIPVITEIDSALYDLQPFEWRDYGPARRAGSPTRNEVGDKRRIEQREQLSVVGNGGGLHSAHSGCSGSVGRCTKGMDRNLGQSVGIRGGREE
jgi:hypothetical protein